MVDVAQVLYEWLTASGTAMYGAFGTRVWLDEAPASWSNTQSAVLMDVISAEPHAHADAVNVSMQFTVYSGGRDLAGMDSLGRTVAERLRGGRGKTVTSGRLLYCSIDSIRGAEREPESGWPRVIMTATFGVAA